VGVARRPASRPTRLVVRLRGTGGARGMCTLIVGHPRGRGQPFKHGHREHGAPAWSLVSYPPSLAARLECAASTLPTPPRAC